MSKSIKFKRRVKPAYDMVMLDKEAFMSAISLASQVVQVMGEEVEALRTNKNVAPEVRKALIQMLKGHLHNVSHVSVALGACFMELQDPNGDPDDLN